jgi:hypothetical protein
MDTMVKRCSSVFFTILTLATLTSFPIITYADDEPIDEVEVVGNRERPKNRDIKDQGGRRGTNPIGNEGGGDADAGGGASAKEAKRNACRQKKAISNAELATCVAGVNSHYADVLPTCRDVRTGISAGFRGGMLGVEVKYDTTCATDKLARRDADKSICEADAALREAHISECF